MCKYRIHIYNDIHKLCNIQICACICWGFFLYICDITSCSVYRTTSSCEKRPICQSNVARVYIYYNVVYIVYMLRADHQRGLPRIFTTCLRNIYTHRNSVRNFDCDGWGWRWCWWGSSSKLSIFYTRMSDGKHYTQARIIDLAYTYNYITQKAKIKFKRKKICI